MSLPLKESKAAADIADLLYDFLPGSGSNMWTSHVTFPRVAAKVGVGQFWIGGSKLPALKTLIERTLEFRRDRFEVLILEIVRAGIVYRQKGKRPIRPEELDRLNGLILEVGFKFPDLWDPSFRAALALDGAERARLHVEQSLDQEKAKSAAQSSRSVQLREISDQFSALFSPTITRQAAGLGFERVLNRLFVLFGLEPREPFRVVGEQIDGSFDLDHEIYLVEAKWEKDPLPEAPLLIFRGKHEGKSRFTRGVFIALNGVSEPACEAITCGKQPLFFVLQGLDLFRVLSEQANLVDLLRERQRLLAEEGRVV